MLTKLKEERYKMGYTTREMASWLGISKAFYSQVENRRRRLGYELAIKIADIFKTKPDKLFYDDVKSEEK